MSPLLDIIVTILWNYVWKCAYSMVNIS